MVEFELTLLFFWFYCTGDVILEIDGIWFSLHSNIDEEDMVVVFNLIPPFSKSI